MQDYMKINSKLYPDISLRVIPGHFLTSNSHVNYYIDMSLMKARQSEANTSARAISDQYMTSTIVDTILCVDGSEVIGAYLANYLSASGVVSMNAHKTIYVTAPEFSRSGQILFRENTQPMIQNKHILLLLESVTTGKTAANAIDAINYYGGTVAGVSAIFSAAKNIYQYPIHSLFTDEDIPNYTDYSYSECPMCKDGKSIDAVANRFGYSKV
ncbi:MAG: orotate phosphoribosyltransferase [Clostridiales bacterium]|nr:orotate phosphoribosyltransferase [Clostridiales bacterium]